MNSSASVAAVPVMPESLSYILKKFWMVIVATVWFSSLISTPSLASMAWWSPSEYRRPSSTRPVNSSTIKTCPSHDVLDVLVEERVSPQGLVEVVDEVRIHIVVEVVHPERFFDLLDAALGRGDLALLLIHLVVLTLPEAR